MKGNFSRESHRPEDRYSGVMQVQGGMVTDADLGEQARIARRRTDSLGHDAMGGGIPVEDGAVAIAGDQASLVEGTVYAEGVRGEVLAAGAHPGPLDLYGVQHDFPLAPAIPALGDLVLYADLWERTVTPLEDALLSDPGLHGAETALRQRTMAQLKWAPAADVEQINDPTGPIPRIGTGVVAVTPLDPQLIADDCDPCADTIEAEATVANALFRLEVVHVFGDPQTPDRITVAWSSENASAVAPATVNSEDFSRSGAVYEFFSTATESQLGVHDQNGSVARSSFAETLGGGPAVAAAPEGGDWPYVRRWDGAADINFNTRVVARVGGGAGVTVNASRKIGLTLDAFTLELDLGGKAVVAGDYWLVELRRFAGESIRLVQNTPIGILHNYAPLFRISGGAPEPLTDEEIRRLSFPVLSNMPATHVSFDEKCPNLFHGAENVQEALDALCDINAGDVAFDPSDCPRLFDDIDNVQDALINLCKFDFDASRILRLLFDWGVICGVVPRVLTSNRSKVAWSAGHVLDRAGRLGDVKAKSIDLNELVGTGFFDFGSLDEFEAQLSKREVCLAFSVTDDGDINVHLTSKEKLKAQKDPDYFSELKKCLDANKRFNFKEDLSHLPEKHQKALAKTFYGAAHPELANSQKLGADEAEAAFKYLDELNVRVKAHIDDTATNKRIEDRLIAINREFDLDTFAGEVRKTRAMQKAAAQYAVLQEEESEAHRRCVCKALIPVCPEIGAGPQLVPICGLWGTVRNRRITIREVCVFSCRKQALSWKTFQYYFGSQIEIWMQKKAEECCWTTEREDNAPRPRPKKDWMHWYADPEKATPEKFNKVISDGFRMFTGGRPPTEYKIAPDISKLGIDQAKHALRGNGIEVTEVIDVDDEDAVIRIRDKSVGVEARDLILDDNAVSPGDKVAMLKQGGEAVGYVKLETKGGKFLFDRPEGKTIALSEDDLKKAEVAVEGLKTKVRESEEKAAASEAALEARLAAKRAEIEAEKEKTARELEEVRASKEALRAEVSGLSDSLTEIKSERASILNEINSAKAELAAAAERQKRTLRELTEERNRVVLSLRKETPVTAVTGAQDKFAKALADRGVTNLASLSKMPDNQLRLAAAAAGLNLNTARRFKREAGVRLEAPIQ